MSFKYDYPNRKDIRRPYRKSQRFDRTCRPHGSCSYCRANRLHAARVRDAARPAPVGRTDLDGWDWDFGDDDGDDCTRAGGPAGEQPG